MKRKSQANQAKQVKQIKGLKIKTKVKAGSSRSGHYTQMVWAKTRY